MLTELEQIGRRHGVHTSAVAHAGDGNLHPALSLSDVPEDPSGELPAPLLAAADVVVRAALDLGGPINGEHSIGISKPKRLDLELSPTSRDLPRRLRKVFDPRARSIPARQYQQKAADLRPDRDPRGRDGAPGLRAVGATFRLSGGHGPG